MRKSNLIKMFLVLIMTIMVVLTVSTKVFAAENNAAFNDLTNQVNTNSTANNANANAANTNTNTNTNVNTNSNSSLITNNTTTNSENNTSNYNNTSLPATGIEDSIPVALLVVVFAISAIYAYKKIKDYRNI